MPLEYALRYVYRACIVSDYVLFYLLLQNLFEPRFSLKQQRWIYAGAALLLSAAACVMNETFPAWFELIYWGAMLLFCLLLYKGNFAYRVTAVVYFYISLNTFQYLTSAVKGRIDQYYSPSVITSVLVVIAWQVLVRVLLAAVIWFFTHHRIESDFSIPAGYWSMMLVVAFAGYFGIYVMNDAMRDADNLLTVPAFCAELLLYLSSVSVWYFYAQLAAERDANLRRGLMEREQETQKQFYEELKNVYDGFRRLRHEMKNHVMYMRLMLQAREYEKLAVYLDEIESQSEGQQILVVTENYYVNGVVDQKYQYARSRGIEMEVSVLLPETLELEVMDLCSVLSNLLDNAIEGCRGAAAPKITVVVKLVKEYISINITNTVKEDVLKKNPHLLTSKKDREFHGLGTQVVRDLVARYDGVAEFGCTNQVFYAQAMMKNCRQDRQRRTVS